MIELARSFARNVIKAIALTLPLLVGLFIIATGISNVPILLLYLLIAFEGMGILYWAISNLRSDVGLADFKPSSRAYFYPDRNRAEVLASYIRSGTKGPSYMRHLSRVEISRILEMIVDETFTSAEEMQTEAQTQESIEIDFVLHPKEITKGKPDLSPNLDYYQSLEHVVSRLEAKW